MEAISVFSHGLMECTPHVLAGPDGLPQLVARVVVAEVAGVVQPNHANGLGVLRVLGQVVADAAQSHNPTTRKVCHAAFNHGSTEMHSTLHYTRSVSRSVPPWLSRTASDISMHTGAGYATEQAQAMMWVMSFA